MSEFTVQSEIPVNYQGPGKYRHYKGGFYHVLGLGLCEETVIKTGQSEHADAGPEITRVIYMPISKGSLLEARREDYWLRKLDDFNDWVEIDGEAVPRFIKVDQ